MNNEELKELWRHRDRLINGITTDGFFRISVVVGTKVVETARKNHELNPLTTLILGRLLLSSALSTGSLKSEERISYRIESKGPINLIVAEANAVGELRGFINNPKYFPEEESKHIVSEAVGTGFLHFTKVLYGAEAPFLSSVPLVTSEITQDVGYYFIQSEQIPSAIQTSISYNEDLSVKQASGFLVQAMPEASEESVLAMEEHIKNDVNLEQMLNDKMTIDDIMLRILSGYEVEVLDNRQIDFFCRCNKDKFEHALISLSDDDLSDLASEEQEIVCHYCNTKYHFSKEDIKQIIFKKHEH